LNEALETVRVHAGSTERADDAVGDRLLQSERVADRCDIVAGFELIRVTEDDLREIGRFDLDHCDVGTRITPDDLRRELTLIG